MARFQPVFYEPIEAEQQRHQVPVSQSPSHTPRCGICDHCRRTGLLYKSKRYEATTSPIMLVCAGNPVMYTSLTASAKRKQRAWVSETIGAAMQSGVGRASSITFTVFLLDDRIHRGNLFVRRQARSPALVPSCCGNTPGSDQTTYGHPTSRGVS